MNFLIYDDHLRSVPLIHVLLSNLDRVTLITKNDNASSSFPSTPSTLTIKSTDITNASHVISNFSRYQNDPFDAIFIFDVPMYTGLNNVVQAIQRIEHERPPLFIFYSNQSYKSDANVEKLLKQSIDFLFWTILIFNEITTSNLSNFQVENNINNEDQRTISGIALEQFLRREQENRKHLHQIIFIHQ